MLKVAVSIPGRGCTEHMRVSILVGVFPLFLKMITDIIAPKPFTICRTVFSLGRAVCWWSVRITAIPKSASSSDRENYQPISITYILSNVFEKLVSHKLSNFCQRYVFLPVKQIAYIGKSGLHWCTAYHISPPTEALDAGMEYFIVQLDFSAAFSRVSHSGFLFKLNVLVKV